jgi:hypothetical protein
VRLTAVTGARTSLRLGWQVFQLGDGAIDESQLFV